MIDIFNPDGSYNFPLIREKAYEYLHPKRIPHVAGCEKAAVALAKHYGIDENTAAVAAILHDVTKKNTYEEQLNISEKYGIINDCFEENAPKLLHAKTGAAVAKYEFGVNAEIESAIRWHTTGKPDMTMLQKIIYMADYMEETRDFDGVEELRRLAFEDIDSAMALGLAMSIDDVTSRGNEVYKDTLDAYNYYKHKGSVAK